MIFVERRFWETKHEQKVGDVKREDGRQERGEEEWQEDGPDLEVEEVSFLFALGALHHPDDASILKAQTSVGCQVEVVTCLEAVSERRARLVKFRSELEPEENDGDKDDVNDDAKIEWIE